MIKIKSRGGKPPSRCCVGLAKAWRRKASEGTSSASRITKSRAKSRRRIRSKPRFKPVGQVVHFDPRGAGADQSSGQLNQNG